MRYYWEELQVTENSSTERMKVPSGYIYRTSLWIRSVHGSSVSVSTCFVPDTHRRPAMTNLADYWLDDEEAEELELLEGLNEARDQVDAVWPRGTTQALYILDRMTAEAALKSTKFSDSWLGLHLLMQDLDNRLRGDK